jgi:predicted nucleic acid-binding protein
MYLIDTNVLSALRRPETAPPAVTEWAEAIPVGDLYLPVMSVYEIDLGIRRMERRDPAQGAVLRVWFSRRVIANFRDRILPINEAVAMRCAQLQVPDPRPERDSFIAATALVHRLTVVTPNVRDFVDMGVTVLNPWDDQA